MSRKRNDDKAMCAFVPVVVAAAAAVDGGGDKAIWNAISHFPGVKLKCTNHHHINLQPWQIGIANMQFCAICAMLLGLLCFESLWYIVQTLFFGIYLSAYFTFKVKSVLFQEN